MTPTGAIRRFAPGLERRPHPGGRRLGKQHREPLGGDRWLCAKSARPKSEIDAVLIYVPQRRSETDEEKQARPILDLCRTAERCFPRDDGDDYLSLCLRAKPDHATEIRRVFAGSPNGPAFSVIDAIGGGASWPQLRAALEGRVRARNPGRAAGARVPQQVDALKAQEGWGDEAREFLRRPWA